MSIARNEIPILEYDDDPKGLIDPGHTERGLSLPARCAFPFLGGAVDDFAEKYSAKIVGHFETMTKIFPVYEIVFRGEPLCLAQAPVGASAAAQFLDWLIAHGVRKIVSTGSCGALDDLAENRFLIPSRALRDEGTSYHYLPPARYVDLPLQAREAIKATLSAHGLPSLDVVTWTTDGFFRETKEKVAYRRAEGCSVVEMECAALAAVCALRGAQFGQLLFTADTLADPDRYDERNWGGESVGLALKLCMESARKL